MIVGLAAARFINNNVNYNLSNCLKYIKNAKEKNLDLLIFGETYLQGFESLEWIPEKDLLIGLDLQSNELNILRKYCKENEIGLGMGYIERQNNTLFSSYLIIDKNGNDLTNYRRMSRGWRENNTDEKVYLEGNSFLVFKYMGFSLYVGLCGDFWEEAVIEKIPKKYVDIVFWPVFISYDKKTWEKEELNIYIEQAKKINKNILLVNSICVEEKSIAYGGAFAVKNNKLIASMEQEKEDLLIIEYEK